MSPILIFIIGGLGTALIRSSFVLIDGRSAVTVWIESNLGLIGSAVLAAIVTSSLVGRGEAVGLPGLDEMVAVIAALLIVRRTQNVVLALAVGLPVYWVCTLVGSVV